MEKLKKVLCLSCWNPLYWLLVLTAPLLFLLGGALCGLVTGILLGYEKGMSYAIRGVKDLLSKIL